MGRSISNYSKLKTSELGNRKENQKKASSKKNKNLTKWGKLNSREKDNSIDNYISNSPDGSKTDDDDDISISFRTWK